MKCLLIIGDGMADNPVPELGGKTPLEAASIPAIDALAARGVVGSVINCPKPLPAGSETGILSIFGCDPLRYFTGRSPMEAPDECTHNGDLPGKLLSIEWLSSRLVAPLVERMEAAGMEHRILLLADHKTLTATRGHDGDPVPFLLYDSRHDSGRGGGYTEREGEKGPFLEQGCELLDYLFERRSLKE